MAKLFYGDPSGVNRTLKKLTYGDPSGVNRTLKKLYYGDPSGVNRLVFSAGVGYSLTSWVQNGASSVTINDNASGSIYSSESQEATHFSIKIIFDSGIPKSALGDKFFKMSFTYTAKNLVTSSDEGFGGKPYFACRLNGSTKSVATLYLVSSNSSNQSGSMEITLDKTNINVDNINQLELYGTCYFGSPAGSYEMNWNSGDIKLSFGLNTIAIRNRTGQLDIQI
ncbi:MAG: hypothetical protein E6593_16465 [Clostridium sp.]|nr:hypothetical protein [Clostridium sp.]